MNCLWILQIYRKRKRKGKGFYPYPAHWAQFSSGPAQWLGWTGRGGDVEGGFTECANARGKRIRPKPSPLKRVGPARRVADERGPVLRPSPTSRSNRAEAGEARPSGRRRSPQRHQPPPAMPSTPAGSGGRAASAEVRHARRGGRMRAHHRPWRARLAVVMELDGTATGRRERSAGGSLRDVGGALVWSRGEEEERWVQI